MGLQYVVFFATLLLQTRAWLLASPVRAPGSVPFLLGTRCQSTTTLFAGGFGGSTSKKKQEIKLKPKQQWDRFIELKKDSKVRVAVRVAEEWLEVGAIKSAGDELIQIAVNRQKALIADHARRLYPLQVSSKDKIEWGYCVDDGEDWTIVDKNVEDDVEVPDGFEKKIGFEGRPDPASGFYCMYNEGRLVNSEQDMTRPSKKLK